MLAEIEAREAKSGDAFPHKLFPSSFVKLGLEIEDLQCVPQIPCVITELTLNLQTTNHRTPQV